MPDGVDSSRKVGATERQRKEVAEVMLLDALPDGEVDERFLREPVKVRTEDPGVLVKVHSDPQGAFGEWTAKEEAAELAKEEDVVAAHKVVYTVVGGGEGEERLARKGGDDLVKHVVIECREEALLRRSHVRRLYWLPCALGAGFQILVLNRI